MYVLYIILGLIIGIIASFSGMGGGFLMVPLLLLVGRPYTHAVGTSFLAILLISLSALIAHNKLAHVEYGVGFCLAAGGIIGAQLGSRLLPSIPQAVFERILAGMLIFLALFLLFRSR